MRENLHLRCAAPFIHERDKGGWVGGSDGGKTADRESMALSGRVETVAGTTTNTPIVRQWHNATIVHASHLQNCGTASRPGTRAEHSNTSRTQQETGTRQEAGTRQEYGRRQEHGRNTAGSRNMAGIRQEAGGSKQEHGRKEHGRNTVRQEARAWQEARRAYDVRNIPVHQSTRPWTPR